MLKYEDYEIYPYSYIYKGRKTVLVWQTSQQWGDCFKLDAKHQLIFSDSEEKLRDLLDVEVAKKVRWSKNVEVNFDRFWSVLKNLRTNRASSKETCELLLNGWNFIEDLLNTFNLDQEKIRLKSLVLNTAYEKLFYGNNLPSITPEGKLYTPIWLREEILAMKNELMVTWGLLENQGYIPVR